MWDFLAQPAGVDIWGVGGFDPERDGRKEGRVKATITNKAGDERSSMRPTVRTKNRPWFSLPQKFMLPNVSAPCCYTPGNRKKYIIKIAHARVEKLLRRSI